MSWTAWSALSMVLIVGEMFSGTFYLLGFGIAAAVGGLVSWFEGSISIQLLVVAATTVMFWIWIRKSGITSHRKNAELDQMDIGNLVQWIGIKDNGVWQVRYRGTDWDVIPANSEVSYTKPLQIISQKGSQFIVDNVQKESEEK
jgi:membrane protein implicated in regulation of membrane protease activity